MHNKFLFWLSFLLLLLAPSLPLFFFTPYIVASCYSYGRIETLWRAMLTGLIVALFSSSLPLPLLPSTYCIACLPLFLHTRYFFSDRWYTLPFMSYLFSFYASIASFLLVPFFEQSISLSLELIVREIFLAPLSDTLLAGIVSLAMYKRKKAVA